MRDWEGTLDWYKNNQTTREIGFNPDGMCLKVCRTARDIPGVYATAKQAQDATPATYRVKKIANLRKGMVLYFDDPNDSNQFGHIVTMIGRVKGYKPDSLHDILVETNSVKSGELVVVRADYFAQHWGDKFQFGAKWLNGVVLDVPGDKPKPPKDPDPNVENRVEKFWASRPSWDVKYLDNAIKNGRNELTPIVQQMEILIAELPKDEKDSRVNKFKKIFKDDRILEMTLINKAVAEGRTGVVKSVRDGLRQTIKKVPQH